MSGDIIKVRLNLGGDTQKDFQQAILLGCYARHNPSKPKGKECEKYVNGVRAVFIVDRNRLLIGADIMSRDLQITDPLLNQPRTFEYHEPVICYNSPPAATVDRGAYDEKRKEILKGERVLLLDVPKREARCFKVLKGQLCRISVPEGPQVGDLNLWNLENFQERFYSGKTRQLHASHLKMYDRLWSSFPHLRPMATIVYDTLWQYGFDKDGGSVHDVIGTRCDDYTYKLITGQERVGSCHSSLVKAVREYGLKEEDVHDVWNVFMLTGFTRNTNQYFAKPTTARKGDHVEFIAEMNLLCALCACPQGDVSTPVGDIVPDEKCFPLQVEVFSLT